MRQTTRFFYEDGHKNVYNEDRERAFDPIKGILTEISDPYLVLERITSQKFYLRPKQAKKESTSRDLEINRHAAIS